MHEFSFRPDRWFGCGESFASLQAMPVVLLRFTLWSKRALARPTKVRSGNTSNSTPVCLPGQHSYAKINDNATAARADFHDLPFVLRTGTCSGPVRNTRLRIRNSAPRP